MDANNISWIKNGEYKIKFKVEKLRGRKTGKCENIKVTSLEGVLIA